jgi:3-oxoacyl-[acyl-carrier protein] reductase
VTIGNTALLTGRRALVTGASRGIGRDIALRLAAHGAEVFVHFRVRRTEAESVAAEVTAAGGRARLVQADLTDRAALSRMMQAVLADGPLGILINNAGLARPVSLDALDAAAWDEAIATNLTSSFLVTQAALPGMRQARWGRIVFLSSVAAQVGGVVGPHYAASKAGMHGMMHYYAAHLAKEGITANVVAPALIDTEMVRLNPNARPDIIPVGRFGQPDEVAATVMMLVENAYITGQTFNVNGGWYLT